MGGEFLFRSYDRGLPSRVARVNKAGHEGRAGTAGGRFGGPDGNERLTGSTGGLLVVLLVVEG